MLKAQVLTALILGTGVVHAATTVHLKNAKNEDVGTATLSPVATGVQIKLDLHGLPPGEHGFHVHENGSCVAPKFETAGGHFAPNKKEHGFKVQQGHHAGDMENLKVGGDGVLKAELINKDVTLGKGPNSLFKKGGTALMIHEKADDYQSQPAGNAGARVACGEIQGEG